MPLNDEQMERVKDRLREKFPIVNPPTKSVVYAIAAIVIVALAGILNKPSNITSFNTIKTNTKNITVLHQPTKYTGELRQWSDLSYEEREAIKAEARAKFPQIADIGSGVNWQPISHWLASEKGVAVSNARDLFR